MAQLESVVKIDATKATYQIRQVLKEFEALVERAEKVTAKLETANL